MTCHTSMLVCMDHKCKCCVERETDVSHCFFVTCAGVCCVFTLLSHYDDFHPHETLSVQSYELCVVQVSRSHLLVCRIIPISTIAVLAPTIYHNSVIWYITVNFGVALCLLLFCVCGRERMPNIRFLFAVATLH